MAIHFKKLFFTAIILGLMVSMCTAAELYTTKRLYHWRLLPGDGSQTLIRDLGQSYISATCNEGVVCFTVWNGETISTSTNLRRGEHVGPVLGTKFMLGTMGGAEPTYSQGEIVVDFSTSSRTTD